MAFPVFDAGSSSIITSTPHSFIHPGSANADFAMAITDVYIVAGSPVGGTIGTISNVTYGGVSMTRHTTLNPSEFVNWADRSTGSALFSGVIRREVWYLDGAASGNQTVTVTTSAGPPTTAISVGTVENGEFGGLWDGNGTGTFPPTELNASVFFSPTVAGDTLMIMGVGCAPNITGTTPSTSTDGTPVQVPAAFNGRFMRGFAWQTDSVDSMPTNFVSGLFVFEPSPQAGNSGIIGITVVPVTEVPDVGFGGVEFTADGLTDDASIGFPGISGAAFNPGAGDEYISFKALLELRKMLQNARFL